MLRLSRLSPRTVVPRRHSLLSSSGVRLQTTLSKAAVVQQTLATLDGLGAAAANASANAAKSALASSGHSALGHSLAPTKGTGDASLASALFPRTTTQRSSPPPLLVLHTAPPLREAAANAPSSAVGTVAPRDAAFFLADRLALISACLASNDPRRAEVLYHRTRRVFRNSFEDSPMQVERAMINAFVEAYLSESPPNYSKAAEWHARAKEFNLTPDISTYAALLHHLLITTNNIPASAKLVLEMKAEGLEPAALFGDRRFSELEDCATLSALVRSMQGLDVDLTSVEDEKRVLQMVLESAKGEVDAAKSSNAASTAAVGDVLMLSAMRESSESASGNESDVHNTPEPAPQPSDLRGTNSLGVKVLRKTLSTLSLTTKDNSISEKLKLQSLLEEKALSAAVEEMSASQEKLPDSLKSIVQLPNRYMATWNRLLVPAIKSEIAKLEADTKDAEAHGYVPFLKLLTPEQLARITITEFLRISETGDGRAQGPAGEAGTMAVDGGAVSATATVSVLSRIGSAIEAEHNLQQLKKKKNRKMIETQMGIHNLHIKGRLFNHTMRKIISKLAQQEAVKNEKENWIPQWPAATKVRAGSVLAILLIKLAKVKVPHADPNNPQLDILIEETAFQHGYTSLRSKQKVGVIKMHPYILERLATDPVHVHPRLLPMIVPPRPWLTRNSGGYLHYKSDVLRTKSMEHVAYLAAADEKQHLSGVFESLDVLGKTAWRVNERVYDVMKTIWNSGEAVAGFPPVEVQADGGDGSGAGKRVAKPENWEAMSGKEKRAWVVERQKEDAVRRNHFSQRCDINYKVEIARSFLGQTIYFPHNLDFRGRAYPMPAHLNHMGNDFCRGLLMFDTKKPVGERGLRWMKIQVANLMGNNKISFDDRAKYAEAHVEDIMDSADKPLTGKRWWLTAEDPWQMLATCFELTEALRLPNPTEYCSGVAIHMDGTCNGLQHYAALGGDMLGAAQVNLIPGDKPGDIYTAVANRVSAAVDKLATQDVEGASEASKLMQGKITRKLVKQTVMTNTYGVTFVGARAQVQARIKEQPELYPFTDDQIRLCSLHITHLIFDSLGELFTGARALQNWLNSTAFMIAKSIPASSIPQVQLDDAAVLSKMGCLPSAFTVARKEVEEAKARERDVVEERGVKKAAPLSMDDFNKQLLDAVLDEEETTHHDEPMLEDTHDLFELTSLEDPSVVHAEAEAAIAAVDSAAILAESNKKIEKMASVIWTTPLGLPIVQPYRAIKTRIINTHLQTVTIRDNSVQQPVNPMKQSTAFPPNFIHSLDATHMMLSAIACNQAGIEFASVHDSYWTHAGDVDVMSDVLRDTFVKLHSREIMKNLKQELEERNGGHKFPVSVEITDPEQMKVWMEHLKATGRAGSGRSGKFKRRVVRTWVDLEIPELPGKGEFDIENVRKSLYFFH
ncbi:DNA-directed RNA polymerase [Podochytrium sp. JEL0797]|nr:DNA-directed RNA polymerase [Podochytrium sp. JEL0797]